MNYENRTVYTEELYREILNKVAEPLGIKFSKFIQSPVDGLVDYHLCHERS